MIRVLVADDQAAVRDGFVALIDAQENMLVVDSASNGREAVDLARRTFPHVVLMDIRMPVLDGLEATRLICADPTLERTRVLVLTTFDLDEYVYTALRAGASGFLLKDTPRRELLHAIEVIAAGDALLSPKITRRLIAEFAARRDPQAPPLALVELTDRERDILLVVARSLSNAEIAGRLVISPLTAKSHEPRCHCSVPAPCWAFSCGIGLSYRRNADSQRHKRSLAEQDVHHAHAGPRSTWSALLAAGARRSAPGRAPVLVMLLASAHVVGVRRDRIAAA
jgi:DNA-binding NarL/FixJ family response regulator